MPQRSFLKLTLLALLAINNPVHAEYLCDPSCKVTASFPNGGSIDAVEQTTFLFGNSGLIDTGASSTAYSKDETLTLNAGESLVFESGGSFTLGDQGNIDSQQLVFDTDGTVSITAESKQTSATIDPQPLSIKGDGSLLITVDQLTLVVSQEPSSGDNDSSTTSCTIDNTSNATLTLSDQSGSSTSCTPKTGTITLQENNVDFQLSDNSMSINESQQTTISFDQANSTTITTLEGSSGIIDYYLLAGFGLLLLTSTRGRKRNRFKT